MKKMKNRKSVSPSLKRQRASKFTGLVLVIPGIILYIYILYIIFSILVYPGSFSPFMGRTLAIINGGYSLDGKTFCLPVLLNLYVVGKLCRTIGYLHGNSSSMSYMHVVKVINV